MAREDTSRRAFVGAAAGLCLAGTAGCLSDVPLLGSSADATIDEDGHGGAPLYRYGRGNTGHAPGESGPTDGVTEVWRFGTDSDVAGSVAVVDNTVYLPADDALYAVDASTGEERWACDCSPDTAPAVGDGTVYVGGRFQFLQAVDPEDGSVAWEFETDGGIGTPTLASTGGDATVVVADADGVLYGVAPDGSGRWRVDLDETIGGAPAVADGTVYVDGETSVYAVAAATGTVEWEHDLDAGPAADPVVRDGTVYVGTEGGGLFALSAADGAERWVVETGLMRVGGLAVSDEAVFLDGFGGELAALDRADGSERWTADGGGSTPTVAGDTVYVGTVRNLNDRSAVYAYDVADGSERWAFEGVADARTPPVAVDGTLFVTSTQGNAGPARLHALRDP